MPSSVHGPQAAPGPWVLRREAQAKLCPLEHQGLPDPQLRGEPSLLLLRARGAPAVSPQGELCFSSI